MQLEQYIATNPLPEIETLSIDDAMLESDKNHLDYVALHHLPPDGPDMHQSKYLVMATAFHVCVATLYPNTRKDIQSSEFKIFTN